MNKKFDYSAAVRTVCQDMCFRLPVFGHIDFKYIGISICQTRVGGKYGVYASITPLRFENGKKTTFMRGNYWKLTRCFGSDKTPLLYIYSVYLPRFQNLPLLDKIDTLIHELYHIGENFDGDIRRFGGRCFAHGSSRKGYDRFVQKYVREWLAKDPPPEIWNFLKLNFPELRKQYGSIVGSRYPKISLLKITKEEAEAIEQQNNQKNSK